jgi:hypothetical protein
MKRTIRLMLLPVPMVLVRRSGERWSIHPALTWLLRRRLAGADR